MLVGLVPAAIAGVGEDRFRGGRAGEEQAEGAAAAWPLAAATAGTHHDAPAAGLVRRSGLTSVASAVCRFDEPARGHARWRRTRPARWWSAARVGRRGAAGAIRSAGRRGDLVRRGGAGTEAAPPGAPVTALRTGLEGRYQRRRSRPHAACATAAGKGPVAGGGGAEFGQAAGGGGATHHHRHAGDARNW